MASSRILLLSGRVAVQQANATIPAENGIVIARRMDFLGFGETAQSFFKKNAKGVRGAAGAELHFRTAFIEKAEIIEALVGILEALKNALDFRVTVRRSASELVGDRQAEDAESELMLGFDGENVVANRLRLFGLIEITVQLSLRDGFGNSRPSKWISTRVPWGLRSD